jgi:predicted N-formylglutamate amidohydrolase
LVAVAHEAAVSEAWIDIVGASGSDMLLIADHASNRLPAGLDLGVRAELMDQHVAIDIGVAPLAHALSASIGCAGVLGGLSRLLIDLNREEDAAGLIPATSDGHLIPGNATLSDEEREARIAAVWRPYHQHIADTISVMAPKLLISLHSFTPSLATCDRPRPWQIGILYNHDDRAARLALPLLEQAGIVAGDNLPYSGKVLNATMNRHGEANSIPYLGIEVRQDLIADDEGVALWCGRLAPIIRAVRDGLAG